MITQRKQNDNWFAHAYVPGDKVLSETGRPGYVVGRGVAGMPEVVFAGGRTVCHVFQHEITPVVPEVPVDVPVEVLA